MKSPLRLTLPLLALLVPVACVEASGKKQKVDVVSDGALTTRRLSTSTGSNGIATLEVPLAKDETSFGVYLRATSGAAYPTTEAITSPDGAMVLSWDQWYDEYSLTGAVYPEAADSMLSWPVRAEDGPLSSGSWQVEVAVTDDDGNYLANQALDVVIQTRTDPGGIDAGTVTVRLVYADALDQDEEVVRGTEAAIERWREVWAAYGLELVLSTEGSDIDGDLPGLDDLSSTVYEASAQGTDGDLMVLVGETIDGSLDAYGIAGGIPGPLVESGRGTVVISWLANAGGDGRFSDDDIRLYGETLAHEVGHYAGLFHPVEDGWGAWDALDDTPRCQGRGACEGDLGDNLMFPYPVCGWDDCTPQDVLSDGQIGVTQRYAGTL